jgi:hypothetical protein
MKGPEELIHGRPASYTNKGCRCPACSAAKAKDRRAYYERVKAEHALGAREQR